MFKTIISTFMFAAALNAGSALATDAKDQEVVRITIDQAKVIPAPHGAATLVIGNPSIADVAMLKGGVGMVVTGKGYGQTNLISIDAEGNVLDERQLRVEPARTVLVVQRGESRASYSCNPYCMPTVQLGDDQAVFGAVSGQMQARNGLAGGPGGGK